jgi:DNA-binding MarR family transcriptional regulator
MSSELVRATVRIVGAAAEREPGDELLRIAMGLRRGTMRLARRLRMERPEAGPPLQELSVLGHLNRRGPMTPGEIAAAERVQPQTLTRTLAALEDKGEIRRQADTADRRRSVLSITDAGLRALLGDLRQRDSWLCLAMAEELTPAERGLLHLAGELMERLAESSATALRSPGGLPAPAPAPAADRAPAPRTGHASLG